jgi:hypothetical protein
MKYYAQAQEDRIMIEKYLRDMPLERRVYFECGALDGLLYSNTRTVIRQSPVIGSLTQTPFDRLMIGAAWLSGAV